MPMAIEQMATAVKMGSLRNTRKAWLTDGNMGKIRLSVAEAVIVPTMDDYILNGIR